MHRVGRNRDAALRVHLVDCRARGLIPVDGPLDADGNQMKVPGRDLLADEDHRTAGLPRSPSTDAPRQRLIVVGDRDDVEADARGVPLQHPRRQSAVTDERMHVKVTGQDLVASNLNRRAGGYVVAQRGQGNAEDEHHGRRAADARHQPTSARVRAHKPDTRKTYPKKRIQIIVW